MSIYLRSRENKAYTLKTSSGEIPVYCHMTRGEIGRCGGGGWTLVMKINGHKVQWFSKMVNARVDISKSKSGVRWESGTQTLQFACG